VSLVQVKETAVPQQAVALSQNEIAIRDYELPPLAEGQLRVRSRFGSAKHGTESVFFKGCGKHRGRYDRQLGLLVPREASGGPAGPHVVGNMFVGEVIEVGPGVTGLQRGDEVLGYGGFRQVQTAPAARCWHMPAGVSWKSAVCLDPADFAMAAVRDGKVRVGDVVVIMGMGAIGLMAVQIAHLSGAYPVVAVDPLANRRQAAEACGADVVLDPTACDVGMELRRLTGNRGADVVLEYSGNVHAMQAALRAVAYGGTVVAGAFPGPYPAGLDLGAEAHLNVPNIVFSRACSQPDREHPRWDEGRIYATCWRLICEGRLSGDAIVTPVVLFDALPAEYLKIVTAPEQNVKLGVAF
jgi:threonine dehydrogenase-like Zn-dependent dehydrogenase